MEKILQYGKYTYLYRMETDLKRKEIWLHPTVVGRLQVLADKKQWSLKQYMEWILTKESSKAIKAKDHNKQL